MIRLLHGNDEFAVANALEAYLEALGPADVRAPNITVFEKSNVTLGEVLAAASVIPFLTDRRAVVVRDMLEPLDSGRGNPRGDWEDFGAAIAQAGSTMVNDLIFVEGSKLRMKTAAMKALAAVAVVEVHDKPRRAEMLKWLQDRFRFYGADVSLDAIQRMQYLGGDDTRRLDGEIRKLSLYADGRRIERGDIDLMVSAAREENIFGVIDAVIDGHPPRALSGLQNLLEQGESIEGVFSLLSRQIRLLILAKHCLNSRMNRNEIGRRIRIHNSWVLDKTCRQAGSRNMEQLAEMHRQLLDVDVRVKTGLAQRHTAIETLIARLAGSRTARQG